VRAPAGPAERFLTGVRAALADLPAGEVDEILDDVGSHLSDLAAELGPGLDDRVLADRLGTPAAYAGELRAAAGYPPPPAPAPAPAAGQGRAVARLAVVGLVASTLLPLGFALGAPVALLIGLLGLALSVPALVSGGPGMTAVAELPAVRSLVGHRPRPGGGFVADLLISWWVVRALLAAVVLSWVVVGADLVVAVPLMLLTVPGSIWVGRLSRRDRRLLWLVVPLNVLAVVVAVLVVDRLAPQPSRDSGPGYSSGLWQDGAEVRDIRPVDAGGVPLTGVYLFDQAGHPIDTQGNRCDPHSSSDSGDYYDADPSTGAVEPYPRGTAEYGSASGRCVVVPPGPLVVAVPTPTAAPAPTMSAAPTAGPTATAPTSAPGSVAPAPPTR
jgi:uncharacterized membrane protein